ncbi:MAG: hypothetical protein KatS3mg076_2229 [Candidatus Binatia bacterium]|nr:MAG: hypothetical protein KatS3mg076_2229 [Candidatus Binatia bacterium]
MSSSWVTPVSSRPPLLVLAVGRERRARTLLEESRRFALHVVGENSRWLEDRFYAEASGSSAPLASLGFEVHPFGVPVLEGAPVVLLCRVEDLRPVGDHVLFVARLEDVVERAAERPVTSQDLPYVYVGRVVPRESLEG